MLILCGFLMFGIPLQHLSYIQPGTLSRNVKKAVIEFYSIFCMALVAMAWLLYKF